MAPRRRKLFAACLLIGGGIVGASQAAEVTVTGTFTSFTSEMGTDRYSIVNNQYMDVVRPPTPLPDGYYQSQTITFPAETTKIDFNYANNPNTGCCNFKKPFPLTNTVELFTGPANVGTGQEFTIATFAYTNGQWWAKADIGFSLTTHSSDPNLDQHTFNGTLRITSTIGTEYPPNPLQEADVVSVLERPDLGSMRVFEWMLYPTGYSVNTGNTGYFAYKGHIGSLVLDRIVPLNTAAFTNASITPQLSGPSTFGTAAPVPEPETYAMMIAGLGLLGFIARRKQGRL